MPEADRTERAFSVKRDIVARSGLAYIHSSLLDPELMKAYQVRSMVVL
jgi:hypothetical protein